MREDHTKCIMENLKLVRDRSLVAINTENTFVVETGTEVYTAVQIQLLLEMIFTMILRNGVTYGFIYLRKGWVENRNLIRHPGNLTVHGNMSVITFLVLSKRNPQCLCL